MEPVAAANEEAIEAWNTILFDKFEQFRELVTTGLSQHGEALLAKYPPPAGARVLDIGCGFGDTTTRIARMVGATGAAVGIDAAARFIEVARREAAEHGIRNVRFIIGDVQTQTYDHSFDYAFSRFGTMFFASPVAALRSVCRALRPGGQLAMVVWRRKLDNEWLHRAEEVVERFAMEPEEADQVTCGPGPFSMAGADTVSDILVHAGFTDISLARCDVDICIGENLEDAVNFACALGPAGEVIRLAGDRAEDLRPAIEESLREALAEYQRDDGVWAPSSTWLISARAPA